jgi:uncharacterized peroxidase-related enzyme
MARVALVKPEAVDDPEIAGIFEWVTQVEGAVPNHFYVEMNFPEHFKAKLGATKVLWEMGELSLEEIQHIGIAVSKANECEYCTAAFCTLLNYGLENDEEATRDFVENGAEALDDPRLKTIIEFALKANDDARFLSDDDFSALRALGLSDKGLVQLVHLVSDFASYNRLNQAMQTDYDYRDFWRKAAFGWQRKAGEPEGDNSRGVRKD